MTARVTVHLGYGKANFDTIGASYSTMKVEPPFRRVSAYTSGQRSGEQKASPVGQHGHQGVLLTGNVQHDEGAIVLLQAAWNTKGSPLREGALFLKLRVGAPLYNVMAFIPMNHANICGDQFMIFSGEADIMNLDDLEAAGIEANRGYVSRYMEEDELAECFRIVEVRPARQARPTLEAIATPSGTEMREVAQMPARRMILRGKRK